MSKWTMIEVVYARIPEEVKYRVKIAVNETEVETTENEKRLIEKDLHRMNMNGVPLEQMVERLHQLLQDYPEAKITMIQEPTRPLQHRKKLQGFELSQKEVDLIRTDLEKAKELFAPIERTVNVRPAPPRIMLGEPEQGE